MGLRDRLRERARPTAAFSLRVDDDTAALAELTAAREADDDEGIAAAQAAVDACYEQLRLMALPPADMEALIAAHPAVEKDASWNPATFVPALLAACVESDVTEEDWVEYTTKGPMTSGEVTALFDAIMILNYRTSSDLGKGSAGSRSW